MNALTSGFALISSFPRIPFGAVDPMSPRDMIGDRKMGISGEKGQ
jgi:hypothetical protein